MNKYKKILVEIGNQEIEETNRFNDTELPWGNAISDYYRKELNMLLELCECQLDKEELEYIQTVIEWQSYESTIISEERLKFYENILNKLNKQKELLNKRGVSND